MNSIEIVGIGTDIVECARIGQMIERYGEYFLERVFTSREIAYCQSHRLYTERFAGRWAAKEAILKALGTGWRKGISWLDLEIQNELSGQPRVVLIGEARNHAQRMKIVELRISISHCHTHAVAFALAVSSPAGGPSLACE